MSSRLKIDVFIILNTYLFYVCIYVFIYIRNMYLFLTYLLYLIDVYVILNKYSLPWLISYSSQKIIGFKTFNISGIHDTEISFILQLIKSWFNDHNLRKIIINRILLNDYLIHAHALFYHKQDLRRHVINKNKFKICFWNNWTAQ